MRRALALPFLVAGALLPMCSPFQAPGEEPTAGEGGSAEPEAAPPPNVIVDAGLEDAPAKSTACRAGDSFGAPVAVAGDVNTLGSESQPSLTSDELTLYFQRDPSQITSRAMRAHIGDPFVTDVAFGSTDFNVSVARDDATVFFLSVAGSARDIRSAPILGDHSFGSSTLELSTGSNMLCPSYVQSTDELWFGVAGQPGLSVATREDGGAFALAHLRLAAEGEEASCPVLSPDGSELFYALKASLSPSFDVWTATRGPQGDFGNGAVAAELSTEGDDYPGWLSPDGCRLYLARSPADGGVNYDLYVATRSPH